MSSRSVDEQSRRHFFVKQGFYDIKIYEPQRHNAADAAHKGMRKKYKEDLIQMEF